MRFSALLTCQKQTVSFPAVSGNQSENYTKFLLLPELKK